MYALPDTKAPEKLLYWTPRPGEMSLSNVHNKIIVYINPTTLESDEKILAAFAHESSELGDLEGVFASEGGRLPASRVKALVTPEGPAADSNLHGQAWNYAESVVLRARQQGPK